MPVAYQRRQQFFHQIPLTDNHFGDTRANLFQFQRQFTAIAFHTPPLKNERL
jgi:hypothetical protein